MIKDPGYYWNEESNEWEFDSALQFVYDEILSNIYQKYANTIFHMYECNNDKFIQQDRSKKIAEYDSIYLKLWNDLNNESQDK